MTLHMNVTCDRDACGKDLTDKFNGERRWTLISEKRSAYRSSSLMPADRPKHFCNLGCLAQWARAQKVLHDI